MTGSTLHRIDLGKYVNQIKDADAVAEHRARYVEDLIIFIFQATDFVWNLQAVDFDSSSDEFYVADLGSSSEFV
ncbi:hypothetical protein ACS0TY_014007 [Phlomoides rotata]